MSGIFLHLNKSFLSAIAGWVAGAIAFGVSMPVGDGEPLRAWPGYAFIGAVYSAPAILVVWFAVLRPVYARLPVGSALWHPFLCTICGCAAGVIFYYLFVRFGLRFPDYVATSAGHLCVGATVGVVTSMTARWLKRWEAKHG